MQMQPKNARSCPKCTQAWLKCVEEAWYSREVEKKEAKSKTGDKYNRKDPPMNAELTMTIDRFERVRIS
jgi:hypothetical protein